MCGALFVHSSVLFAFAAGAFGAGLLSQDDPLELPLQYGTLLAPSYDAKAVCRLIINNLAPAALIGFASKLRV